MKFTKLKSSKISEAVANQVLKLIKEGSLKPTDKLPIEMELASSLGVSRTAVREGMARLHAMGIIEILPGRGTYISKLPEDRLLKIKRKNIEDIKTLVEALEFRKIMETSMLEMVIDKITKDDLIQLKGCLEKHKKGLTKNVFPAEGDMLFHKILAQATHNKVFIELYDDIYLLIIEFVLRVKNYKSEYKKSLVDHEKIYKSLLERDVNSAKEAMKKHIEWLIEIISQSKE
ncbi:MAG: FadR family transcriptional regulator, partial [Actinobacteria bacterium]|nr:FadR family transcriptional regulator [Actinomycetota bacterium]